MTGDPRARDARPAVLVFRKRLLPWSETFIAAQAGALSRYRPVFVGYRCGDAGPRYLADHDRVVLADHARIRALSKGALKSVGWVTPRWRRALAAHRPALLHVHFGVNALAALPIARTFGIPLVVTYHGMDITVERSSRAERRRREKIFARAARIIAVSQFIAGRLRDAGCPEEKLTVHSIGVDTRHFSPADPAERAGSQVLFVGRLVEKKGLIHLIRAMVRVQQAIPGAELVVAGDGGLRPQLEAEAERLGARCRFLGVQTPAQVQALMRRASLLCAPSVVARNGDAEGLGMVIVEAQATGTPIVTFRSGGAAESVVHGETGLVAPERDEGALARHLVTILADPSLRDRMAAAARAHVLEHFDLRRQTAALERIYDEILAG